MAQRKEWDPERMKAAVKAIRNREMGSYKASRCFNVSHTTLEHYVNDQQKSSSETVKKQNWVGSKFIVVKQKMIWLSTVF
jgi:hypothetical protein